MPIDFEPHVLPVLFGILPPNFEEQGGGRMCYHEEGDTILICENSSLKAAEDFKQTELYQAIQRVFEQFPAFVHLLLQPGPPA